MSLDDLFRQLSILIGLPSVYVAGAAAAAGGNEDLDAFLAEAIGDGAADKAGAADDDDTFRVHVSTGPCCCCGWNGMPHPEAYSLAAPGAIVPSRALSDCGCFSSIAE